jgi:hypothetical protein
MPGYGVRIAPSPRGITVVKLSNLVFAAAGYTLGARAGRERYEDIVRLARRVAGSQTVQATAGVVQGQVEQLKQHARDVVTGRSSAAPAAGSANGHRR